MKNIKFSHRTFFIGLIVVVGAALVGFNQLSSNVSEQVSETSSTNINTDVSIVEEQPASTSTTLLEPADVIPVDTPADPAAVQAIVTNDAPVERSRPTIDTGQRVVITLAGGCFWCTEAYMQETPGVVAAISGYAGGEASTANYKEVSKGTTAHREAVQVTFDPARITVQEILAVYWSHINPTDAGGQFADRGTHYTTAIYYHTDEQRAVAVASKMALAESGLFTAPIVTLILPYTTFFEAEEYHQDYYKKAADHYERYKRGSGRAGYVEENWAKAAALEFLESQ